MKGLNEGSGLARCVLGLLAGQCSVLWHPATDTSDNRCQVGPTDWPRKVTYQQTAGLTPESTHLEDKDGDGAEDDGPDDGRQL